MKGETSMFECAVVERMSKGGKPYVALEITFPGGYKKLVFLTPAESCLIQLCK